MGDLEAAFLKLAKVIGVSVVGAGAFFETALAFFAGEGAFLASSLAFSASDHALRNWENLIWA